MVLDQLTLIQYKNIQQADLSFSEKVNCFLGNNGMGKTNLLDAIYHLSFCKSITNPADSQNILHGTEFFMIQGDYHTETTHEEIHCALKKGQKKIFKRNKKKYDRFSEHIGMIPLVIVSPDDTQLINGASEERRKFMDQIISQTNSIYLTQLIKYKEALSQRNALLKQESPADPSLFDFLEEQMHDSAEYIYQQRANYIAQLTPTFQLLHQRICSQNETVGLALSSHLNESELLELLQKNRDRDRIIGYTTKGIHRDDLTMLLEGHPLRLIGSQGQAKTYVVALKLAQYLLLSDMVKTKPILLLDDIFDKLDGIRVEQIIALLAEELFGQTFITDTNRVYLDEIIARIHGDYRLFIIHNGAVELLEN